MKNLKQKIILCVGIILTGLIVACSNPFIEPAAYDEDTGNVIIRIAGSNERTILPEAPVFSRYELKVTGTGAPAAPSDLSGLTGNGVSITLPAGTYTVTVKAYRLVSGTNYIAAQGSKSVTVNAGPEKTAVVIDLKPLNPLTDQGDGFFSYNITLPSGDKVPDTATLNLKSTLLNYDQTFNLKTSAASSAPIKLQAGYYEMFISLKRSTTTAGEYAAVHIYSGMETKAVLDLKNGFATINLDTLQKVIDDVKKELASMKVSTNGADVLVGTLWVTQNAVNILNTALSEAQALITSPPDKQAPVNTARQNLETALATFKSSAKQGTKFENATWTGLMTEVATPVTVTTSNNNVCVISIPLAGYTNSSGGYQVAGDGKVTFSVQGATLATGTVSGNNLTLSFPKAILGVSQVTLTKGTPATPKSDIEYLYSGIWSNSTQPALTYISGENWAFSIPGGTKAEGAVIRVYDRKAAFYKKDGTCFAVGKVAIEQAERVGNSLTIYPLTGGSHTLNFNPFPNPFVGNWQGGSTINGTLYAKITTWTLETASGAITAQGEYVWSGDTVYLINTNGTRYATGTINSAKTSLTVVTTSGQTQVFTLIDSPFKGTWKATLMVVATITAAVTTNTFDISANVADVTANGQYTWRNENGVRKGYFYLNGHSYGSGVMNSSGNEITVTLDEPIDAPVVGTIKSLTLKK